MRVAVLVSNRCTVLKKMIELAKSYSVVAIFADSKESEAVKIGKEHNIPVIINDIKEFYAKRGKPLNDMQVRKEYDSETSKVLSSYNPDILVFAGYMHVATSPLIDSFLCVNFHPADLTILNPDGSRKYVGKDAVKRAILAGEKTLRSSIILADHGLDTGKVLMLSEPVKADEHAEAKLEALDTLPKALQYIAEGRFSKTN